jgi:hypothetical protein
MSVEQLLAQLAEVRRRLASKATNDYRLAIGELRQAETPEGVEVTADVAIVTTVTNEDQPLFLHSDAAPWTFQVITIKGSSPSKGWKVTAIEIPDICATYYTDC